MSLNEKYFKLLLGGMIYQYLSALQILPIF